MPDTKVNKMDMVTFDPAEQGGGAEMKQLTVNKCMN